MMVLNHGLGKGPDSWVVRKERQQDGKDQTDPRKRL